LRSRIKLRRRLEASEPLKGQLWTRSERALREPDVHWSLRAIAGAVAVAEVALLGWLWFGPALAVRTVNVAGAQHLTSIQVAEAAGLTQPASVLAIDGEAGGRRLLNLIWVRAVKVEPQLPGTVQVVISEWQPVAVYHAGPSSTIYLMSDQAVLLAPTTSASGLVEVQGPGGTNPKVGERPIDVALLTAMVNIQRQLPALLAGQQVAGFIFDSCGQLTLISKRGWKVYFGRVLTPEQFRTLGDKVAALKAIAGRGNVNYNSPDLEYVNVMNPNEPAVGFKSLHPATPSPSPGASPRPSPSPSPASVCK
jgi:cell division septal protein FtsQ